MEPTHYDFMVERLQAVWNFLLGVFWFCWVFWFLGFFLFFYSAMQVCAAFMGDKGNPFLFMRICFILFFKTNQLVFSQHKDCKLT